MSSTQLPEQDRLRVLLGILAGVVVLAGLWFFVVSPLLSGDGDGGGADETPTTPAPASTEGAPADEDADGAAGADGGEADEAEALPVATYEVFLSRDPFEPVIPEPAADPDGDGTLEGGDPLPGDGDGDGNGDGNGDGTDGDGTNGDGSDGDGTDGDGVDGGDGDGDACTGTDEVVCDGRVVSLVDVFTEDDGTAVAVVQVDNELYEVRDGDVFAENFQVMAVDPPCVTLLFGDDSFTLCEGERVLK